MTAINYGYPSVPEDSPDEKDHRRRLARGVNGVLRGHINVTLDVTLTPSAASTSITDPRITQTSAIVPAMAMSSNAAADLAAGIYISNIIGATAFASGAATINHRNSASTGRIIRFLIIG